MSRAAPKLSGVAPKLSGVAPKLSRVARKGRAGSEPPAKIWLMDGSIYFFRGYFGIPPSLVDRQDYPVNGVLGFAQALLWVLRQHPTGGGAVTFDESLGTGFRHRLYGDYKANRARPDADVRRQFRYCKTLCEALGIACWASAEYEADDLLATLASRSKLPTIIYSKDKDLHQLISKKISICDARSDDAWDLAAAQQNYGFAVRLLPDYQALVGDASDNVPGVPGIGPKTARRLIAQYGSLEQVLRSVSSWSQDKMGLPETGRVALGLADYGERALAMRELLRLVRSVALPTGATRRRRINQQALTRWLARSALERRLSRTIEGTLGAASES